MKTYSHDYTKAASAQNALFCALQALRSGQGAEAELHILEARDLLDDYLASDNMVEDDDVYPGWVRGDDADEAVFQTQEGCIDAMYEVLKKLKAH